MGTTIVVLGLIGLLGFFITGGLRQLDAEKMRRPLWQEAAQIAELTWSHQGLSGVRRGFEISVTCPSDARTVSGQALEIEVKSAELRLAPISIASKGVSQRLSALARSEAEGRTGDADFDEAVWVAGPPMLLAGLMDHETRSLVGPRAQAEALRLESGRLILRMFKLPEAVDALVSAIEAGLDLAHRLQELASPELEARLCQVALEDPLADVRMGALQMLLRQRSEHSATTEAVQGALHDPSGVIRLVAIEAAGEAGLEALARVPTDDTLEERARVQALHRLHELQTPALKTCLESLLAELSEWAKQQNVLAARVLQRAVGVVSDAHLCQRVVADLEKLPVPLQQIAVEALGRVEGPEAEPALIQCLNAGGHSSVRIEAIKALGRLGGREAIAPIHELADARGMDGRLNDAAQAAIKAIQGRLGPRAQGGLTLATHHSTGRLSVHQGGHLSRPAVEEPGEGS